MRGSTGFVWATLKVGGHETVGRPREPPLSDAQKQARREKKTLSKQVARAKVKAESAEKEAKQGKLLSPTRGCSPIAEAVAPYTAQGLKRKAGEAIDDWNWSTLMTSSEAELHAAAEAEKEAATAAEKEAEAERVAAVWEAAAKLVATIEAAVEAATATVVAAEIEAATEAAIEAVAAEREQQEVAAVVEEMVVAVEAERKRQQKAKKQAALLRSDGGYVDEASRPAARIIDDGDEDTCCICFLECPNAYMPCCRHHVHSACIKKWHGMGQDKTGKHGVKTPKVGGGPTKWKPEAMERLHECPQCGAALKSARVPRL